MERTTDLALGTLIIQHLRDMESIWVLLQNRTGDVVSFLSKGKYGRDTYFK